MNEVAYIAYQQRAKRADELYNDILELYDSPWNKAYFMAIRDKMLTKEEKNLVKEFHPVKCS